MNCRSHYYVADRLEMKIFVRMTTVFFFDVFLLHVPPHDWEAHSRTGFEIQQVHMRCVWNFLNSHFILLCHSVNHYANIIYVN
jgi:hypothetical protein